MAESSRREEARRWILQAQFDLKAAEWTLQGGFFNTVCFLAQQSAEKALKSVLYYKGVSRTKLMTHSTVQLLSEAGPFIASLENLMDDARELDLHYIPARYPNGLPGGFPHTFYGEKTASAALQCAERIIQTVLACYETEGFDFDA
jgi:HEPN domain-containing protein